MGGKHKHHHGHHGGGYPFMWGGGGPGWWDYPRSELVVVDNQDKSRDKILAYIASLPEKERAKAFTKFFGATAGHGLAGFIDDLASPKSFVLLGGGALLLYMLFRPQPRRNPRRRRYRRRR